MTPYDQYVDGRELLDAGDLAAALPLLESSFRGMPHFKTALCLAECHLGMKHAKEYGEFLKVAFELHAASNEAATRYAEFLLGAGNVHQAGEIVKDVLRRSSQYGPAMALLKRITLKQ